MNKFIFSALLLSAVTANAQQQQVGINTAEPKATLHVEAGASENKGVIIPRITAAEMKAMTTGLGADHHSMMTYLKEDLSSADRIGKLVEVTESGYYFYNHSAGKWQKFGGGGGEQDLRALPTVIPTKYNHLTKEAGVGGNGSSLGGGFSNIGIGETFNGFANSSDLTGSSNIAMGSSIYYNNAGTMSGTNNVGIGQVLYYMSGGADMQGLYNVALGQNLFQLQKANAQFTSVGNAIIGSSSFTLQNGNLTGNNNVGLGSTLYNMQSGDMAASNNIAMGGNIYAFNKTTGAVFTGSNNTGIGKDVFTLQNGDLRGSYNTGIGKDLFALQNGNLRGSYNIAIGIDSYKVVNGDMINTASSNIALGNYIYRLHNNSASVFSGKGNIGIGNNLYNLSSGNLTGQLNIGMGDSVFNLAGGDLSGYNNIGIGNNTMYGGTGGIGGTFNTALGAQSMRTAGGIAGNYNIALGSSAMDISGKITGRYNIAIGTSAMNNNIDISGNYNIGIGSKAMSKDLIKGNNNIQIGNMSVDTIVAGQLNKVVTIGNGIGNLTTANTYSNVILLGHDNPVSSPKVGVGTYQPKAKLDVAGAVRVANDTSACTSANEGAIRYVSASKKFQGCDGTSWVSLN